MNTNHLLLLFVLLSCSVVTGKTESVFQVVADERSFAYLVKQRHSAATAQYLANFCSYKNDSDFRSGTYFDCTINDVTNHITATDNHDFDQDPSRCHKGEMRRMLTWPDYSSSYTCTSTAPEGWPLCGYEDAHASVDCSYSFDKSCTRNAGAGWPDMAHDAYLGAWNEGKVTMGFNKENKTWGTEVDLCDVPVFKARNSGNMSFNLQSYSNLYILETINDVTSVNSFSVEGTGNVSLYHILSKGTGQVLTQTTGNVSMVNISNSANVTVRNSASVIMADISHSTGTVEVRNVASFTGLNITVHSGTFTQTGGSIRMKDLSIRSSGGTVAVSQATLLLENADTAAGTIALDDVVLTGTNVSNMGALTITKSSSGTASVNVTNVTNTGTITVDGVTNCNATVKSNTGTMKLLNGAVCSAIVESNNGGTIDVTGAGAGTTLTFTGAEGTVTGKSDKVTVVVQTPPPTETPAPSAAGTPAPSGAAAVTVHKVTAKLQLSGVTKATFDETAFLAGVAEAYSLKVSSLKVESVAEVTVRATALHVQFSTTVEASTSSAVADTIAKADATVVIGALKRNGVTGVTGVTVVEQPKIEEPQETTPIIDEATSTYGGRGLGLAIALGAALGAALL